MAVEIRRFTFTIPAGTLKTALKTQVVTFPPRVVTQINIRVPPGPAGQMGFSIGSSGNPVIPIDPGTFVVTDNERIEWPLERFWDSGSWEFFGYNLGQYDHSVYIEFLCDLVPIAPPPVTPVLSPLVISSTSPAPPSATGESPSTSSTTLAAPVLPPALPGTPVQPSPVQPPPGVPVPPVPSPVAPGSGLPLPPAPV